MILRILIVAALQIVALGAMIADRMWLLASGKEATIAVIPVDPSDIFRGDYVTLRYGFSQINAWEFTTEGDFNPADTAFVTIKPSSEPNGWIVTNISHQKPDSVEDGSLMLKGRVTSAYRQSGTSTEDWANEGKPDFYPPLSEKPKHLCPGGCPVLTVEYGIESYFLEQGTGQPIEQERNDGSLSAKVAVDSDGRAGIKALMIDGSSLGEVTLF